MVINNQEAQPIESLETRRGRRRRRRGSSLHQIGRAICSIFVGWGSADESPDMIGTTRSRVNFFMNKFKKLGYIEYSGGLKVNDSLVTVILQNERLRTRPSKAG